MSQQYHFDVKMSCSGCSGAIERVLSKKTDVVSKYDVSLDKQSVDVTSTLPYDEVLTIIKKTGKEVLGGKVVQ